MLHLLLAAALHQPRADVCTATTVARSAPRLVEVWEHGREVTTRVSERRRVVEQSCTVVVPANLAGPIEAPSGDEWPGIEFGGYGNTAYADCTLAAIADLEQIYEGADAPLVAPDEDASPSADPFVGEYLTLSGGSSTAGLSVTSVLNAWAAAPIDGVQISGYETVPLDETNIEAELDAGTPLLAWFELPAADAASYVGFPTAPWTTSAASVDSPLDGTHVGVIVGATSSYLDVATWGYVQQVSWQWWSAFALGTWKVIS